MKIIEITQNKVIASLDNETEDDLINHYVLLKDKSLFIGEITELKQNNVNINLLGEIVNNTFIFGINDKPTHHAKIEIIGETLTSQIISYPKDASSLCLGKSPIYPNIPIYINLNTFFNSHFTIIGGTGSGKSFALSKIIQTLFLPNEYIPYNARLFIFDTYGEYNPSFMDINKVNPYINFKNITTNPNESGDILSIPLHLLDVDDLAILLNADTPNQLQILEKALELVNIFKREEDDIIKVKNDIISRAILDILLSGRPAVQIRDQIFSILSFYNTNELNLETIISQPGYNRSLKQCLIIDNDGKLREIELLTKFFNNYLLETIDDIEYNQNITYTLEDLENAIDFALISEGILKSEKIYDNNNLLKVRIHNLIESEYSSYFKHQGFITKEDYVKTLINKNNQPSQIINFNINYVDDRFAKTIVKILSKILFDVLKNLPNRASMPFHIILEEAHRYVQNDKDINLIGYNIFERIAKEGRKYGVLLGLITQRPKELSETVLSQCNNYLVFKMTHPEDVNYIKKLIPYMTDEVASRVQLLQPGNCYGFGPSFKLPMIIKMDMPSPTPRSNNVDILETWFIKRQGE